MLPRQAWDKHTETSKKRPISQVFQKLLPQINAANKLPHPAIDFFTALDGSPDWNASFRPQGCGAFLFAKRNRKNTPDSHFVDAKEQTLLLSPRQTGKDLRIGNSQD